MFKINKNILIVSAVVIVLAIIIAVNFVLKSDISVPTNNTNSADNSQNIPDIPGENSNSSSNISGQETPTREVPTYSGRPINEVFFGTGFSAPQNIIAKKTEDLNDLKDALEKDQFNFNDWIAVGVTKKFFNDYEGARDAWEYVIVLYPNDALAFENLGNLYALYLHDNSKAEYNYKKAIEKNSLEPSFYIALSDFYRNFLNNNSKAIDTILSGLEKIKDANLFLSIAGLYRDIGDKPNAIKYYEEVLKISPNHSGIQEEINRLSN
jgi:tetratricopeptide (TPR) repeat protein